MSAADAVDDAFGDLRRSRQSVDMAIRSELGHGSTERTLKAHLSEERATADRVVAAILTARLTAWRTVQTWHAFAAGWPAVTHKGRARRQRHRRAARQAARHLEHLEHVQTDRSAFSAPVGVYGPRTAVGYHHPRDPENARDGETLPDRPDLIRATVRLDDLDLAETTARRALTALETSGLLMVDRAPGKASTYTLIRSGRWARVPIEHVDLDPGALCALVVLDCAGPTDGM